jgi:hypothetical protein
MTYFRIVGLLQVAIGMTVKANDIVPVINAATVDNVEENNRDKSGTRGGFVKHNGPQVPTEATLAGLLSLGAERGGFEPPVAVTQRWFSKPVRSATLPPLRVGCCLWHRSGDVFCFPERCGSFPVRGGTNPSITPHPNSRHTKTPHRPAGRRCY